MPGDHGDRGTEDDLPGEVAQCGRLVEARFAELSQLLPGVIERPRESRLTELPAVAHDAHVVRLAVDLVVTAVQQAQVVPELVHQRAFLLIRRSHVVPQPAVGEEEGTPAPERDHQVVALDLGAAGGRAAGLVVSEERVVVHERPRTDLVRIAPLGC